jgi:hypothetical protein
LPGIGEKGSFRERGRKNLKNTMGTEFLNSLYNNPEASCFFGKKFNHEEHEVHEELLN